MGVSINKTQGYSYTSICSTYCSEFLSTTYKALLWALKKTNEVKFDEILWVELYGILSPLGQSLSLGFSFPICNEGNGIDL